MDLANKVKNGEVEFQNVSFSYVNKKDKECLMRLKK